MPTIRCSNECYKALQDKALQRGEPVSIVLDRVIWGLDSLVTRPKPESKPELYSKTEPKAKPRSQQDRYWAVTDQKDGTYTCPVCKQVTGTNRWELKVHLNREHGWKLT